jgi:hypothetical protein
MFAELASPGRREQGARPLSRLGPTNTNDAANRTRFRLFAARSRMRERRMAANKDRFGKKIYNEKSSSRRTHAMVSAKRDFSI